MHKTLLSSLLLAAGVACGQSSDNGLNLHHLYRPMDGKGFHVVDDARTLRQGEITVSADFSHAHNALELGLPGDTRTLRLIRQLSVIDVSAAVGLFDGVSLGVALPLVVDHDGRELLNLNSDVRSGGVGAARIQLKATLYERRGSALDFAVALKPFMTFHTGRPADYLSDNEQVTGGGMIQAELGILQRLRVGAELGFEALSSDADIGDLDIRDRIRFGLAVEFMLLRPGEPQLEPLPQSRWLSDPAWTLRTRATPLAPRARARIFNALAQLTRADGEPPRGEREQELLAALAARFELDPEDAPPEASGADEELAIRAEDAHERRVLFAGAAEAVACDGEVSWPEKLALKRLAHANEASVEDLRQAVARAEAAQAATRDPDAWLDEVEARRTLRVVREPGPDALVPGEPAWIEFLVENPGASEVTEIEVEGLLPAGVELLEVETSAGQARDASEGRLLRVQADALQPGESFRLRLRVVAQAAPTARTPVATGRATRPSGSPHAVALGVEVFGWTDAGGPFHNERERPIEAGGYLRYEHSGGFFLRIGAGLGLNNGVGAPDARYTFGGGFRF